MLNFQHICFQTCSQGVQHTTSNLQKGPLLATKTVKVCQKWGFCRRAKGVRFKKSTLGPKGRLFGGSTPYQNQPWLRACLFHDHFKIFLFIICQISCIYNVVIHIIWLVWLIELVKGWATYGLQAILVQPTRHPGKMLIWMNIMWNFVIVVEGSNTVETWIHKLTLQGSQQLNTVSMPTSQVLPGKVPFHVGI